MNKEQFIELLKPHPYRYISSDDPLTLDSITKVSFSGNELYNFCEQYVDSQTEALKKEIEELRKKNNEYFISLAHQGVEVNMLKDGLDSSNAVYFALTGYNYSEDLQNLLDGCNQTGAIEIVDEPCGSKQNEDCGIFKDIHVDQHSVGDSGDSFEGEIYAKVNEIWLKIPYNC